MLSIVHVWAKLRDEPARLGSCPARILLPAAGGTAETSGSTPAAHAQAAPKSQAGCREMGGPGRGRSSRFELRKSGVTPPKKIEPSTKNRRKSPPRRAADRASVVNPRQRPRRHSPSPAGAPRPGTATAGGGSPRTARRGGIRGQTETPLVKRGLVKTTSGPNLAGSIP